MMKKIIVIGTSGSGKTTFATELSQILDIPHIETDNLYWGPQWTLNPYFIEDLRREIQQPQWVICGNYSKIRDWLWPCGTHLIWLDYPFYLVFWRTLKRALIRILTKKQICGDNQESLKRFFSRQSILLWVIQTYRVRKKEYQEIFKRYDYPNLILLRFRSPRELKRYIQTLKK